MFQMHLNGRPYRLGALLSSRTSVIDHYKKVRTRATEEERISYRKRFYDLAKSFGKSALTEEIYI